MRRYDRNSVLELVNWIQKKNHRAYLAHRRKKENQVELK